MQPAGTLHPHISRILLAGNDTCHNSRLEDWLSQIAPSAEIRATHTRQETFQQLLQWHPVLLIIDLILENENILVSMDHDVTLPLAPFTLGIAEHAAGADIALAMRYGFSDFIDQPIEADAFQRKLLSLTSRLPLVSVHIGQMIYPYLYSGTPIEMKRLLEEIDTCIFDLALQVTTSKNGIGRMLGISRQLVQYHLKKKQADHC